MQASLVHRCAEAQRCVYLARSTILNLHQNLQNDRKTHTPLIIPISTYISYYFYYSIVPSLFQNPGSTTEHCRFPTQRGLVYKTGVW